MQNNRNNSDIAYIRPVINGCQEYEGVLYSNEAKVKDMLTVKPLKCNLNRTVLKVVVNEALPYCKVLFRDNKYILDESVEGLMINALAKKFNFRYEVLYANQSWGTEENGVWVGSVGHVFNKRADIAICDLTKSLKRMQVIDFTDAYSIVPLTFVTLRPGLKSRKWITITPFSIVIWILMIIAFVVISVLIQIFYFIKYHKTYSRNGFNKMSGISIALIGALLQQSNIKLIGNTLRIRVLYCLWFLSSLILMKTYGGVFYSVLTLPKFERPIETLNDLERVAINRENDIFTYKHSYYFDYFAKAECCDAYHTIGQSLIKSKIDMPSNLKAGIEAVEMSQYLAKSKILIMTYQALAFGIRSFASIDMYLSTDALMIDQLAMAVQKGSPILNSVNEAIILFIENGLFIKWMSQSLLHIPAKPHSDESTTKQIKTLELIDLQNF